MLLFKHLMPAVKSLSANIHFYDLFSIKIIPTILNLAPNASPRSYVSKPRSRDLLYNDKYKKKSYLVAKM